MAENSLDSTEELSYLRHCIRALVALSTLPAVWTGRIPAEISRSFAEALLSLMRLELIYIEVKSAADSETVETACTPQLRLQDEAAHQLGESLLNQLQSADAEQSISILNPFGDREIQIFQLPIGPQGENGRMVAASTRADFPSEIDRLLFSVGVTQLLTSLKGGKLLAALKDADQQRESLLNSEQAARAEAEIINRIGQVLSAELNLEKLVQAVTDAATELTGAEFGSFFYNVNNEQGESYVLYTLSGVPREAFSKFPMPRNTEIFAPTFRGEGVVRLANVKQDPRYGKNPPYHGMPAGHLPVTSYLAVSVVSRSGEVMGGLFFGHSKPEVFTERAERIIVGLAAQAAIAIDNARLFQKAQEAIQQREQALQGRDELLKREQEARKIAEDANRIKDEFIATVSHELRTPLTSILGWMRLLRSGKLDSEQESRAFDTIERNVKSQAQLVEDLLDISRITSGKLRLKMVPLSPITFINAAVDAVRPTAELKDIKIRMIFDSQAVGVSGDTERLQQVIWNLLSNAVKFTAKGGMIEVELQKVDSSIQITVKDNGEGIKPAFLPYIFSRFTQADGSDTRSHGGLGLGLAIAKHIVELHGGTISAASEGEGRGATFTVKLPIATINRIGYEKLIASQEPSYHSPRLVGQRILVVDDEPDTCEMLKTVFEKCGAEVKTALSTAIACEIFEDWQPAILISDIGMPDENGYELIRRIRARSPKAGGDIPAVALTAFARIEDRIKVLSAGFQMHVPKPVEPDELIAIVSSLTDVIGNVH